MANNGDAHVISTSEPEEDDEKLLRHAVHTLPPQLVKDLLSHGVCARCTFRIFGLHEQVCSRPNVATLTLNAILYELIEGEADGANSISNGTKDLSDSASVLKNKEELKVCDLCLGILQFVYNVDKGIEMKKDCASDFASAIRDFVKQEGHQIDSFSPEVSLPSTIVENEQALWTYMKRKYSSESWFPVMFTSEIMDIKDFLKLTVTNLLETLLDVKSNASSFRIRLTYTHPEASTTNQHIKENNGGYKRRKTGDKDDLKNGDCQKVEGNGNSSIEWKDDEIGFLKFHQEKVNKCCSLNFQCSRTSIYIGGRYLKFSRNVSQSRWIIDDERMGETSVEELIGGNILPMCQGDSYKFHAAGREDIDVRMLGTGRPFLVEIINARQLPSEVLVKAMERKINSLESKFVKVKNLKTLGIQGWDMMREGEAEKQKQYAALVWISRHLDDDDVQTLLSLKEMQIIQKTPVRVLHRRSPLEREKTIHWMKVEKVAGSSQYFLLHLCTQAGTYIKEFVHGDLGRTHPNVGSILKCRAEILQLDVTDVKMDCFQA